MKKIRQMIRPYMVRPFIHMAFTRFVLSLAAALLIDFFFSSAAGRSLKEPIFLLFGVLFGLLALVAWLRLDGVKLPKIMMLRINPRKKPSRMYGDMIDYVDEQPQASFEDLEDGEKDVCILGADVICCGIFLIASLFV